MSVQVHVHRDAEAAALAAAIRFIELGRNAIEQRGCFSVALAGGTTPIRMYEILSELCRHAAPQQSIDDRPCANHDVGLDWKLVFVFFTDERCVPPDHPASNYAMVRQHLFDRIEVCERHIHRIEGEQASFELAAERYEGKLRSYFGVTDGIPSEPTFDLVLLGVGEDGHTASLFPGSPNLSEKRRWVIHSQAPENVEPRNRITLTLPVINSARRGMFLVSGVNKSHVVRPLLAGLGNSGWPAAMVRCVEAIEWHIDEATAGLALDSDECAIFSN